MTKAQLVNKVSRTFHRTGLKFKKHSPEILIAVGVIGTVASAVMACKATMKLNTVLDEAKENIEAVHTAVEKKEVKGKPYTEHDGKKEMTIVYAQTGLKLAKLYAPSVVFGAASLGCILTSHNIIRKRNIALAAAYTAVDKGFKEYRGRVVERFGKELDRELKYNIKAKEVEETVVDEKGKEKTVKKVVEVVDPNCYSVYSKFYDCGCNGWDPDPSYSLMFLKQQQNHANDLLKARGYLYLNEVYDMLGIPRTKAGQIVGWIYDEVHPIGDNFVDFGIWDKYNADSRDFVNGKEQVIILDFNVDGPILELMQ